MHCGKPLPQKAEFCPNCGYFVAEYEKKAVVERPSNPSANSPVQVPVQINNYGYEERSNGFAVAGFVLCFFSTMLGLIFGCIGKSRAKECGGNGKGLATAAIVICVIRIVIWVLIIAFLIVMEVLAAQSEYYEYPEWVYPFLNI